MSTLTPIRVKGTGIDISPFQHAIDWPSEGTSETAVAIMESLKEMIREDSGSRKNISSTGQERTGQAGPGDPTSVFESLAEAKIMTSRVVMHLDKAWRDRLFAALDSLLDIDDWSEDDQPILPQSFATFLRFMLQLSDSPEMPGLGVSDRGSVIAAWTEGNDRLTIEFLPADAVQWSLSCIVDDTIERAAGDSSVQRLLDVLSPYKPSRWFNK